MLFNSAAKIKHAIPGMGVKLTTHLHLVPRSRMCGAVPPLPNVFMPRRLVKPRDFRNFILETFDSSTIEITSYSGNIYVKGKVTVLF
jgi:hypothetical protein